MLDLIIGLWTSPKACFVYGLMFSIIKKHWNNWLYRNLKFAELTPLTFITKKYWFPPREADYSKKNLGWTNNGGKYVVSILTSKIINY